MIQKINSWLWYFGIILTLIGLLFSYFLVGVGTAVLLIAWLTEKDFQQKIIQIKNQFSIVALPAVFLIFFVSILWSENKKFAFDQIFINLPLFFLPIVIATSRTINEKYTLNIFKIFVLLSVVKTIEGFFNLIIDKDIEKEILAGNLSHIIISTTLTWSLCLSIYFLLKSHIKHKIFYLLSIATITTYIYFLNSYTGYIVLITIIIFNAFYFTIKEKKLVKKIIFSTILLGTIAYIFYLAIDEKKYFFPITPNNSTNLPTHTANGNPYWNNPEILQKENGNFVYSLICEKELKEQWNRISKIDYNTGHSDKGYPIKDIIIRYLTSLNLPKDSLGLSQLTAEDIKNIENSCTNKRLCESSKLREMIYLLYWQIYEYITTKDASNKSLAQRIEYIKVSLYIIKDHLLLGTGIGDYKDVYKQYLDKTTKLPDDQKKYAHNQYLNAISTVGILLGTLVLVLTFLPFFTNKGYRNYLTVCFMLIITVYMFSDIIFGRSQMVTFLSLFYTLLIYKLNYYDKQTTS